MKLQENIDRIRQVMGLNESKIPSSVMRRANIETLEKYINIADNRNQNICDDFYDGYEYADFVIDEAIDKLISEIDDNMDNEDYYPNVMDYFRSLCRDMFGEYLMDIYRTTCFEETDNSNTKQEQTESEITERCWKGYTQKGMKTMFGKRYPNCVKKTK